MTAPSSSRRAVYVRFFAAASVLCLVLARFLSASHDLKEWPVFDRVVMKDYAPLDASMVLSGSRRLGGDLGFIQLLQYFSSDEDESASGEESSFHDFYNYSERISTLNPYFHYAYIFSAGTLAFVLKRPQEALSLLRTGIGYDPSYWRYRLYAGAIAYREKAEYDNVIQVLEEAMKHPDCPSIVKNILAGIYKARGNYLRAAQIYQDLLDSRDEIYQRKAEENLKLLVMEHGIVLNSTK